MVLFLHSNPCIKAHVFQHPAQLSLQLPRNILVPNSKYGRAGLGAVHEMGTSLQRSIAH